MNLIIDVGNSRIKLAVFQERKILLKENIDKKAFEKTIQTIAKKYPISNSIVSATGRLTKDQVAALKKITSFIEVSDSLSYPFKNKYKTPKTLGADRYAVMTSAFYNYPNTDVLVIDAGTCITYDYLNAKNEYRGGAISPGIQTRYTSLNNLTANLPLLEKEDIQFIAGRSTNESIHSGVINGVIMEIDGVIDHYKSLTPHLTIILTGGDANFLANRLKNTIFATSNFLLEGLNFLLEINVSK